MNSVEPGSIHSSETPLLWLIRHGETEWSLSGAHTGKTDIPLTQRGREQATAMHGCLENRYFSLVLSSPRKRALETARLAGFDLSVQVDDNLSEWDYGEYEGRTTNEIRSTLGNPNWSIWDDIPPGGESLEQVALRAQKIIHRAMLAGGNVALFSHAHFLRILAAVWIDAPPQQGTILRSRYRNHQPPRFRARNQGHSGMEHALPLSRIVTIVMQIHASTAMSAIFSAHFVTPEPCPQIPLRQPSGPSRILELHRERCLCGKAASRTGSPQPPSPPAPAARPMTTLDEVLSGFFLFPALLINKLHLHCAEAGS